MTLCSPLLSSWFLSSSLTLNVKFIMIINTFNIDIKISQNLQFFSHILRCKEKCSCICIWWCRPSAPFTIENGLISSWHCQLPMFLWREIFLNMSGMTLFLYGRAMWKAMGRSGKCCTLLVHTQTVYKHRWVVIGVVEGSDCLLQSRLHLGSKQHKLAMF